MRCLNLDQLFKLTKGLQDDLIQIVKANFLNLEDGSCFGKSILVRNCVNCRRIFKSGEEL